MKKRKHFRRLKKRSDRHFALLIYWFDCPAARAARITSEWLKGNPWVDTPYEAFRQYKHDFRVFGKAWFADEFNFEVDWEAAWNLLSWNQAPPVRAPKAAEYDRRRRNRIKRAR
jgi:hypothetical protein